MAFSLDEVLELIEFCVHNAFVAHGGKVLRQSRGFPRGDASPDLASLYCMQIEKEHLLGRIKQGHVAEV